MKIRQTVIDNPILAILRGVDDLLILTSPNDHMLGGLATANALVGEVILYEGDTTGFNAARYVL